MYEKTIWKARKGANLNRFEKLQETERFVILENKPNSVTEHGTPFSTGNMNKIEDGIFEAHEMIVREEQERITAIESEAQARINGDTAANTRITAIEGKIPNQASASNKLADKDFVNSSVTAMASHHLTYDATRNPFPTKAALNSATTFYYKGQPFVPTEHDYCVVQADETNNGAQARYGYDGSGWTISYIINDKPFTAAQSAAIDSGATEAIINSIGNKVDKINIAALTTARAKKIAHNAQGQITTTEDLTKSDISLGNVTNDAQVKRSEMGVANGVATLDSDGLVPASMLPEGGGILEVSHDSTLSGRGTVNSPLGVVISVIKNALFDEEHPIGDIVQQLPSTKSPLEKNWRGTWVCLNAPYSNVQNDPTKPYNPNQIGSASSAISVWNRPVMYGLATAYPSPTTYNEGAINPIAANQYYLVTHADGDQSIYKSKAHIPLINDSSSAFNGKIGPFDPVKWIELTDSSISASYRPTFVFRERIANHSYTSDLAIGATVTYNNTSYRVVARHGLGGKFLSGSGGNRPLFESDGVFIDRVRNVKGSNGYVLYGTSEVNALYGNTYSGSWGGSGFKASENNLDIGRVVPTGNENSPRTLSVLFWLRIG